MEWVEGDSWKKTCYRCKETYYIWKEPCKKRPGTWKEYTVARVKRDVSNLERAVLLVKRDILYLKRAVSRVETKYLQWVPGSSCEKRRITFGKSRITCKKRLITWYLEWEQVVYGEKWRMSLLRISFFFSKKTYASCHQTPKSLRKTLYLFSRVFSQKIGLFCTRTCLFSQNVLSMYKYMIFSSCCKTLYCCWKLFSRK